MTDSNQPEKASRVVGENVFFAKRTLQSIALLVGITIMIAAIGIIYIASQFNEQALSQSRLLVENVWHLRQDSIKTRIKDNAFWGDAYQHLSVTVDTDWAYISRNLGPSLYKDFSYEGVFVIDGQGNTRYSVINGQLVKTDLQSWLNQDITPLIDAARQKASEQYIATQTLIISGQPTLIAAAKLTTGGDPQVRNVAGADSVLVFVDILTQAELRALGESYGIHNLHARQDNKDASSGLSLPIPSSDHRILSLHWDQNKQGAQLLNIVLPLLALVALILGLAGWLFAALPLKLRLRMTTKQR